MPAVAQQGDWIVTVGERGSRPVRAIRRRPKHPDPPQSLSLNARRAGQALPLHAARTTASSLNLVFQRKHLDFGPVLNIRDGRNDTRRLVGYFQKIWLGRRSGCFRQPLVHGDWFLRPRAQNLCARGSLDIPGAVGDAGIDYIHTRQALGHVHRSAHWLWRRPLHGDLFRRDPAGSVLRPASQPFSIKPYHAWRWRSVMKG